MMLGKNSQSFSILERIPEDSIGVELGVWKGESSEKFLTKAKYLHLVDSWSVIPYKNNEENGTFEDYLQKYKILVGSSDIDEFQKFYDNIYISVVNKFKGKNVKIHRMDTKAFFTIFTEMVDWVYVDAAHDHAGCYFDLINSFKIVKTGGSIFGDDYLNKPGVRSAVDFFVKEHNLKFYNFYKSQYQIVI